MNIFTLVYGETQTHSNFIIMYNLLSDTLEKHDMSRRENVLHFITKYISIIKLIK